MDEIADLQSKLEDFNDWSEMAQTNISELEEEKEALEVQCQELSSSLDVAKKDKLISLESCVNLEREVESLRDELSAKEEDINLIRNGTERKDGEISKLQEEMKVLKSRIESNDADNMGFREEIDSLKEIRANLESKISTLPDEMVIITRKNESSKKLELDMRDNISLMEKKVEEFSNIIDGKNQEIASSSDFHMKC